MASTGNETMKRLRALSECCICLTTYTDPRMLPCLHTACLKCFEDIQLKNGNKPGDVLPCPLCRNEFPVPAVGMKGLQRNFFIESLMEVTNAFKLENQSRPCTMCCMIEDASNVAEATLRCLNCCEDYCLRCSRIHKTLKGSKDHRIAELNIEVNEEEIRHMFPIRKCVRHSDKVLDYYCSDCKTVVCVSCFVEDHKTHECKDVTTVDMEFRQRIEQSFTEMNDHKDNILSKKFELERKKRALLVKTLETESVIKNKNQELKALIDRHTEEVLNKLSLLKQQQEKIIEAEVEEIETKLTVLESFVTYCSEFKSKGSASEICGGVDKLLTRAKELSKEYDEYLKTPSKSSEFEFIATDQNLLLQNACNFIGKLSDPEKEFNCYAVVIANFRDAIKINLNRQNDVTALKLLPVDSSIRWAAPAAAAAVYSNSIFVCGLGSRFEEIWRLDSASSKWNKCASLIQGKQCHSVAFVNHVLYICGGYLIYRHKVLDDVEAYNTHDDRCSKIGNLSYGVFSSRNCVPFRTSLYIFGGCDVNKQEVNTVQVYDTKLNTCILLTNQMPRACGWLRGELWKNYVILLGKRGCFIYDIDTQTWKVRYIFQLGNDYSGVAVNDDKLFVIGCGANNDDVKWIPVANILNDELTEWKQHAKLPKRYCAAGTLGFASGRLNFPL